MTGELLIEPAPIVFAVALLAALLTGRLLQARAPLPAALVAATLPHGLVMVWVAMTVVFMGARGLLLSWRARGEAWLVTGARLAR